MSNSSNNSFNPTEMFKALSNPHRLSIFKQLCVKRDLATQCHSDDSHCCCVGELGEVLDIAPSTLSHHLKELNRAGLVLMQRKGKSVECSIDPQVLKRLAQFFSHDVCCATKSTE